MILVTPDNCKTFTNESVGNTYTATNLTFTKKNERRNLEFIGSNFEQFRATFQNQFYDTSLVQSSGVTLTYGTGVLTATYSGSPGFFEIKSVAKPNVPFCCCKLKVVSNSDNGTNDIVGIGLQKDSNNLLRFYHNKSNNQINYEIKVSGSQTLGTASALTIAAPFEMAFVLCNKWASVLVKEQNSEWRFIRGFDTTTYFDFRMESVLVDFFYSFIGMSNGGSQVFEVFSGGIFGQVGFNDLAVISDEKGVPIYESGRVWVTVDCAGITPEQNVLAATPSAHMAVGLLNLENASIEITGKIFVKRSGAIKSDRAGRIVYDSETKYWKIMIPNWGDYTGTQSVLTYLYSSASDPRYGISILENGDQMILPGSTSQYDTTVIKINGVWNISYTTTNSLTSWSTFYPSLCIASSLIGPYSLVGTDSGASTSREGNTFLKVGGTWVIATSSSGNPIRYYDLSLNEIGSLNITNPNDSYFAWPTIIPIMKNSKTYYKWISHSYREFQALKQSFGNIFIYDSDQQNVGYEFQIQTI